MTDEKQAIERVGRGRYAPGQSGNPGGRAAVPAEIKEMLGRLTPRAVEIMAETLECDDPKLRFQAAQEVLNRSLGKPVQALDVKATVDNGQAHLEALRSLVALAASRQIDEALTIDATPVLAAPVAIESDEIER